MRRGHRPRPLRACPMPLPRHATHSPVGSTTPRPPPPNTVTTPPNTVTTSSPPNRRSGRRMSRKREGTVSRSVVRLTLLGEVNGRRWLRRVFGSFSLPASHGQPAGRAQRLNEGPPEDACAGTRPTPPHHHTMEAAREPRASGQLADGGRGRRRRRRRRKPQGRQRAAGEAASSRVEAKPFLEAAREQ